MKGNNMNNQQSLTLAVKLCCADMSCGYISNAPVLGTREALIAERLAYYHEQLTVLADSFQQNGHVNITGRLELLTQAVALTSADILSDVISVAPVLYDRNEKIIEQIKTYFCLLNDKYALTNITASETKASAQLNSEAVSIVLNKKRKKRRR